MLLTAPLVYTGAPMTPTVRCYVRGHSTAKYAEYGAILFELWYGIVNPSVKLVPRDARCVRDACAQRCFLNLDTVELTGTKLAHQARAAVVRGILPL